MRLARRIALLASASLCAAAGLAYAGVRSGVLPLAGAARHHHVPIIRVRVTPKAVSLKAGSTTRLHVTITGRGWPRTGGLPARTSAVHLSRSPVRLTMRTPSGFRAAFTPRTTVTRRSLLTLRVATGSRVGRYRLRIVATRVRGRHSRARVQRAFRTVIVTVRGSTAPTPSPSPSPAPSPSPDDRRLLVGGNLRATLVPGAVQPLDAKLGNPFDVDLDVTAILLTAIHVAAPQSSAAFPCDASDFALQPLTGPPVHLKAGVVASLSDLGVPQAQWPAIAMLDRATNQDGCKGAVVTFSYSAVAQGVDP